MYKMKRGALVGIGAPRFILCARLSGWLDFVVGMIGLCCRADGLRWTICKSLSQSGSFYSTVMPMLFDDNFGGHSVFSADVDAGGGIGNFDAVEVVVFNGIVVGDVNVNVVDGSSVANVFEEAPHVG